jgi:hypothetical protein
MSSLRQRIRKVGIKATLWKQYKSEIRLLPISSQTLFKKNGLEWDILEMELKDEGWLSKNENLWEVLSTNSGLMRQKNYTNVSIDPIDSDKWTDEDWEFFYSKGDNYVFGSNT